MSAARALLLAATLAGAPTLRAQQPAPPAAPVAVDGRQLRPQRLSYLLTLRRDSLVPYTVALAVGDESALALLPPGTFLLPHLGAPPAPAGGVPAFPPGDSLVRTLGTRTLSIVESSYGATPAWVLRDSMSGPIVPLAVDSLVVSRADLAPLHWEATQGLARLAAEFTRDTLYGAVQGPQVKRSVVLAGAPGLVANAATLEAWLQLAPLQEGWQAALPLLLVDLGGARVLPAVLTVLGVERMQAPAGEWECWIVAVRAEGTEKRLWVRRDAPLVVRSLQSLPGGAVLETVLTAAEGR